MVSGRFGKLGVFSTKPGLVWNSSTPARVRGGPNFTGRADAKARGKVPQRGGGGGNKGDKEEKKNNKTGRGDHTTPLGSQQIQGGKKLGGAKESRPTLKKKDGFFFG